MPEVIKCENMPAIMDKFHIEPFHDEYIPGALVLCREDGERGDNVFFQIPTPVFHKLNETELEKLKSEIHVWWKAKDQRS